ncbi:hypothetical protein M231_05099 [Tremella mesenterica]|uniref:Uncharacterized protein n=1 Tax=Tremella mesenterica TaxID=5217 RepID=A0A4Q1BIV7_TREME|nr:hypothetical protein M231_05099 [Tremella mesenterica]
MDVDYAKRYLPNVKTNPLDKFELQGLGRSNAVAWIEIDLNFISIEQDHITVPVAFFLVPDLLTKIIIGNDILSPMGAIIDLANNTLNFKTIPGTIPTTCKRPERQIVERKSPDSAIRPKESYTFQPGYQHRVGIVINDLPTTPFYVVDPKSLGAYLYVGRSVGNSKDPTHFAHIVHLGDKPITLKAGTKIGQSFPAISSTLPISHLTHHDTHDITTHFNNKTHQDNFPLDDLSINPSLSNTQQQQLIQVLKNNYMAFGYGARQLGSTTLAEMTIDSGDASPISQAPYHASPGLLAMEHGS